MKLYLKIFLSILAMLVTAGEATSSTAAAVVFHKSLVFEATLQRTDYYPSGLPFPNMLNPQEQPYKYNGKEFDTMHGLNMYDYGARHYDAAIMRWHVPDVLAEARYSITPYAYTSNNPVNRIDPTGMLDDWYQSLEKGRVEHREGSEDRFDEGLIHLAGDDASIGDIDDALSSKNYEYRKDASVEGGYRVNTDKQYKGWAATQIFSPEIVGEILFMSLGTGSSAERVTEKAVSKTTATVAAKDAAKEEANIAKTPVGRSENIMSSVAKNSPTTINGTKFTGHALDQMQARGILSPSSVLNVVKNPAQVLPGNTHGTTVFIRNNLKVVTNSVGDIITVMWH